MSRRPPKSTPLYSSAASDVYKRQEEDGTFAMLPKKEVIKHQGEIAKLEKYLGGVKDMKKLPGALFIVDPRKERNAIAEARKLHIPIVAIVDTNCDPDEVDYVIPGLSLIHISEPTRQAEISYAVFCLKKKKKKKNTNKRSTTTSR